MQERRLSVHEIAAHLGVNRDTIYKWIERKKMPGHKVGLLRKFLASEVDAWVKTGVAAALHRLLRRAFQLGKSLPDELLHVFHAKTAGLPRSTEAERLVVQRVGQDIFRQGLMEYWEGRCAMTGLAIPALLRASHIKPWADCATDAERLDIYNGLLLAPHVDALFDQGFVTVADDGSVAISPALDQPACKLLGLGEPASWRVPITDHQAYLGWHRERVFKKG
jgi:excisionase family DNA binding protein